MPKTHQMAFSSATTGSDVLEQIRGLFEVDRRLRKKEIQAVAEVNANTFIQNELAELFETLVKTDSLDRRSIKSSNFEWLSDILSSVAAEEDKLERVDVYLEKTFSSSLDKKSYEMLSAQTRNLLEDEFKKIKNLKKAYYYRNRSVKAIVSYLESDDSKSLLSTKLTSSELAAQWIKAVIESFANYEVGEKFTRNSYISEFGVFLHDAWREIAPTNSIDTNKSFSSRVQGAITSEQISAGASPSLNRAYQQLSSYYEVESEKRINSRIDLVLEHGAVEFKAVKGEGLYAYYKPLKENKRFVKDLATQVLAASFNESDLPDIGTQIVENPGLMLIIKCLGKPDAATIKAFERFVSSTLR
jgi:hypothetical protein